MIKHIKINSDLHIIEQDIILTHEFGHAVMNHKAIAVFYDFAIFNETDRFEMCSNFFTADWLVEDNVSAATINTVWFAVFLLYKISILHGILNKTHSGGGIPS